MARFELPETLPTAVAELDKLRDAAKRQINVYVSRAQNEEELTADERADWRRLLEAVDKIDSARDEAVKAAEADAAEVSELLERAAEPEPEPEPEPVVEAKPDQKDDEKPEVKPEVKAEAEPEAEEKSEESKAVAKVEAPEVEQVAAAAKTPVTFAGLGNDDGPKPTGPGWEMDPSCPGYRTGMGRIGFKELAEGIDSVRPGSRSRNRPNKPSGVRGYAAQVLARLERDCPLVEDSHGLYAAIEAATDETALPGGSLTAAGGWCAPSEQLYDFCDVPNATDLVSLPEITIRRGGIRYPNEPDYSVLLQDFAFQWFFTEPELEAVSSGDGTPTAFKECIDIPCADEFTEIRLNAIGYCVEAGILMTQGWPELIAHFLAVFANAHLRGVSWRTINDMVNGSTLKVIPADTTIGTVSSVLNSLALTATNLRAYDGYARGSTVEGVAPNWFAEVVRADFAMMEGLDTKYVTDAQVNAWLHARGINLQYVGDWQTMSPGYPGDLDCLQWPTSVDVIMYLAGTWFRSMSNIIELGIMYPKEELQVNRYTRFFTEDAIAVGSRCHPSLVVRIPICVNGAISDRVGITCGGSA